jgi:hypothetical protein
MTERPALEVADVIRRHGAEYRKYRGERLSLAEDLALKALGACRTAAMGGHVARCDACGHERIAYNSCRNRHCPKCRAAASARWLQQRAAELLPVAYFHVVFTLPRCLAALALQNKRLVYDLLFGAVSQTLTKIAADPKHLGAEIGFLAVLHTWGQNLLDHPHVHCVVPGGGLSADGSRWIASGEEFFLPVRVLSRVFRGKFLDRLKRAFAAGELTLEGQLKPLADPQEFQRLVSECYRTEWVVYCKPPFGGPEQVLKYLARYTHRVAISNRRIVALENGQVTFRWKNYAQGNRWQKMTLSAVEFLRRFFLHLLPSGFVRIRHYGFLANRHRDAKLARIRHLLGQKTCEAAPETSPCAETALPPAAAPPANDPQAKVCPVCGVGRMRLLRESPRPTLQQLLERPWDSS